ncbi:MAG: DUF481 domain-containing protein [Acidobacteria bacterium]|nr:DUF481 domain-containing protein [Acidobacteriota bacterium]
MNIFLSLMLLSFGLHASDQIIMKNGDRLTGAILKYDGKEILIQSEFAGKAAILWDAVTEVKAATPIYVSLKDGRRVLGTVATTGGNLTVNTPDAGTVVAAKESVAAMRNKAEQAVHDKQVARYRTPGLADLWGGFADIGFAQSSGNAIVSTVNSSVNATRATLRDKITAAFTSIYSRNSTTGRSMLNANAIRGGLSYSINVDKKMFVIGSTDFEFDEFQKLDLRFVPAAGFGHHSVKNDNAALDLFAGGSLNKEYYSTALNRTSGEAQFGDDLTHKFFKGVTTVKQKLVVYPNLTQTGEYRLNLDVSQATKVRKWLAWQVSLSNRYISNPAPGRKTNDVIVTTGFRVTFSR